MKKVKCSDVSVFPNHLSTSGMTRDFIVSFYESS